MKLSWHIDGRTHKTYSTLAQIMRGEKLGSSGGLFGRWRRHQLLQVVALVLVLGVFMIAVNIYQLRLMQTSHMALHGAAEVEGSADMCEARRKVWVAGKHLDSGYLQHVFNVFARVGYQRNNGGLEGADWDIMWAHDYPFGKTFSQYLAHLKPHQRVNHFPGTGFITNKVNLATSDIKHIPKAFKIPSEKTDLLQYSKQFPDKMWVQKSNNHRGIKIKALNELSLDSENTFVQEYVDKPYLIDGHRFDIGLYTVVTSIDPLRVYVFQEEWLIRFCPTKYYPFDQKVLDKYVVTDDYLAPWDVPTMAKYYTDQDVTRKEALMNVLKEQGLDGEKLESDLLETVVSVFLEKEKALINGAKSYPSSRHFFEMVRFDFVLDEQLNVYLMEVNMSPNLSSGHFVENKLMYEQVVYGLVNLVGLASPVTVDFHKSNTDEANMQVSSKNIRVYTEDCSSDLCKDNCGPQLCKLCKSCLKGDDEVTLKAAYREHVNRHGFQRVFPRTFQPLRIDESKNTSQAEAREWEYEDENFTTLNPANQWMTLWFRGKCIQDITWCG